MKVITIASQKGGAGKTTLAAHLAIEAERQRSGPVALVDLDPQGSLAHWWNQREADSPVYIEPGDLSDLPETIIQLREAGYATLIIDTPPALSEPLRLALSVADFVVLPTRASPTDLQALGATLDLIDEAEKDFGFVLNAAKARSRLAMQAILALGQHGRLLGTVIDRVDFPTAMIDGRTAQELEPDGKAATDLRPVWMNITKYMKGK